MSDKVSVLRGPRPLAIKTRNVLRTMTTGTALCTLPKGSRILWILVEGVASDAVTTATLGFGTTVAAANLVTGFDVKTVATGRGPSFPTSVSGAMGVVYPTDTTVYAIYAETGGASTVGNWKVSIGYTDGNLLNDGTI